MILAGIDIGTLTCRLLIAAIWTDGQLTQLRTERQLLRLGDGVDELVLAGALLFELEQLHSG